MSQILRTEGLSKSFGAVHAAVDVSLEAGAGEVVGLLGPNGAGKSTILRMIAGILTPDAGRVFVQGINAAEQPLVAKAAIGFQSGDTQLYQRLTAREALFYFGHLYGLAEDHLRRRVDELIDELQMRSFAGRPSHTLSSGQKQRANIARAFLHSPPLLVLDEPTAALDVISGQFIIDAIRREKAAGCAVLLSTHIMGEAEYLCDRIALLYRGHVVDQGALPELLERSGCSNLTDAFLKHAAAQGQEAA
jgi:sodium transport system ATP-binding protein